MGTIKCIFFSEFHPTAGPKLTCQVPADYITKEEFDSLHVYVITKPELQSRVITVNALGHKIVGCPVFIDNPKYARNALIFNVCFVFESSTDTVQYEEVVKKVALYFTTLELEDGFLSKEETITRLPDILVKILQDLNVLQSCYIPINNSTTIHLKVTSDLVAPYSVQEHDVPILDQHWQNSAAVNWDLATEQLLPFVDGFKHVARIATDADMDINIVKTSVQNLVHYGAIKIISMFQYGNMYATSPDIGELVKDKALQEECCEFVRDGSTVVPTFRDVLLLYCGLTAGTTVRDLCSRYNPHSMGVDPRKLIQFGLMHCLIRRLHKYPVKLPNEAGSSRMRHLYRWFNGNHNYDEICCQTGLTHKELDEKLENDPSIVVCWK